MYRFDLIVFFYEINLYDFGDNFFRLFHFFIFLFGFLIFFKKKTKLGLRW
jgi:hypothetical protein